MDKQKLEHDIKSLDLKQNAIKILINSFYGAFGNRYFYFHNNDIAQSITLQGQDLIKFSIRAVNHYFTERWHIDHELHEKLGISGYKIRKIENEAAVYTDTDSVYLCFDYAVQSIEGLKMTDTEALEFCLSINRHRLKDYFGQAFEKYAAHFNTNNRQNFELENISRSGIWMAKKKYVLKVSYKDNKHEKLLEKESLIIKGLEAIQSSYPIWARKHLQDLYSYLLDMGYSLDLENDLIPKLMEIKTEFMKLPVDEIAFNFSVRVFDEYITSVDPLVLEKGMPIYGRAAAYHNHIIKKNKSQKYSPIRSGSKVKFYYASPNDYEFDIFAYEPGKYPEEFALPINMDLQFFRLIVEPVNKLLVAMKFSEINEKLTRRVEIAWGRLKGVDHTDEMFPLYAVNSETLDYSEIPESCQTYLVQPDLDVPRDLFPTYLMAITKYGLSTVIVPKYELKKYRDRVGKKLGIDVSDPFALTPEQMIEFLNSTGEWTQVIDGQWAPTKKYDDAIKKNKDFTKFCVTLEAAYKKAARPKKEKKPAEVEDET
jgi:hypothetical protein